MFPVELTNEDIKKSAAYKEYYAIAFGVAPPKKKVSERKMQSSSDTIMPPPMASGTRLSTSAKRKQPAKSSKAKGLYVLSKVALTEAEHIKLATKRSLQQTHISQSSGSDVDEGTRRDVQMTDVHTTQVLEDTHVTLTMVNPDGQQQSLFVSYQFVTSMFNPSPNAGIDSLFKSTPRVDVPVTTIVVPLLVTAPTLLLPSIPIMSQVQKAPTPTPITAPSTSLQDLPNFGSLFVYIDHWMNEAVKVAVQLQTDILQEEAQAENEDFINKLNENIQKIIKEQLEAKVLTRSSNSTKTSYVVAADLSEMELKKILYEKIESNKSIYQLDEQRNLYKALVDAYECDKIILDTYGDTVTLKRRRDDADKDKEPFARSDRGSKRRREGKEPESTSAPKEKASKTTGKSTERSKYHQKTVSESAPAEETMHTTQDLEETSHQEFEIGAADDQPITKASQHPECNLAKQADSHASFNELMDTPVDFLVFLMNQLNVDTLTPELLAGPTYKLMKGSCYDKHALWGISHWGRKRQQFHGFAINRESARDVYSKRRIIAVTELKIVEWHNYKHLDWIMVRRDDDKIYKFKEGNFKRLRIQDIEDMRVEDLQLGVESYQKKLNLTRSDTYRSDLKHKEAYIAYSNPRGFIYQNKDKHNRLMWIDELHKFGDGTLTDVRTALDDRLKGIQMKYLPQSIWRKSEKDRAATMI
nr:hypothetical protein [Tanacetum cinerariifolium]